MAQPSNRAGLLLAALRRHPEIDQNAAMRVAGVEGLSGGIGDGGHAFGPFQLNNAGGVITGKFKGETPQQINEWAWSPQGIETALQGISHVSAGQHGAQAVNSIVRGFERPADPNGEVARALGGSIGGGAAQAAPSPAGAPATDGRHAFAQQLLASISPTGQLEQPGLLQAVMAAKPVNAAWGTPGSYGTPEKPPASPTSPPGKPSKFQPGIAELLQEGTGGPTHSTGPHIHAAFTDPRLELAAINYANQHGLHVGENPYVGSMPAPGVHAKNSYHYRDFPGLYNGRKLGEAIDVSGPNAQAFYGWLAGRQS